MNALRLLGFAVLCLLVSPLIILATTLYSLRIFFVVRPRGISGTAYEPLWSRLFLDELGGYARTALPRSSRLISPRRRRSSSGPSPASCPGPPGSPATGGRS